MLFWVAILTFNSHFTLAGDTSLEPISDLHIISSLTSKNIQEANQAAHAALQRGISLLPQLLAYQGDRRIYAGTALLNPRSSILLPIEVAGFPIPESEMERATTLEVAALYLISAIYYNKLPFANAPLLVDKTANRGEREARNRKEYLEWGYKSARQWFQECQKRGLEALRQERLDPLAYAKLSWY